MNKTIKTLILLAILATCASAQLVTLSSTTLSAAVTGQVQGGGATQTLISLASTSGMLANGPNGQVNTILYVDNEVLYVKAIPTSTTVTVTRGAGLGKGARVMGHASGTLVYYANTQTIGNTIIPATRFIVLPQTNAEVSGTCTASSELVSPLIYSFSGNIYVCGSGGQWINTASGTISAGPGRQASAFCTGNLGSAETEYLNGTSCSGATTATFSYVAAVNGTLYGLYANAGTAVTGGSSKDVMTVYINGVASAITCTFATGGAATTCSDTTHTAAVTAGQYVQFKFVTATSDAGANVSAAVGIY